MQFQEAILHTGITEDIDNNVQNWFQVINKT